MLTILYLDPGTGALVLQVLAAGAITIGLYFRKLLVRPFVRLFGGRRSGDANPDGSD